MALREQPIIPPHLAWPREKRLQTMRDVVTIIAGKNALKLENARAIAKTYSVLPAEVEAEMMRHLSESEGK
jgi:hypothetical protein